MNFYFEWEQNLNNIEENIEYTKKFLSKAYDSVEVFNNGTTDELIYVCEFLKRIPIDNFIYCIDEDIECTPNVVIQYSSLRHALVDVNRVIKFSSEPLTFAQLGSAIIRAQQKGACKKYGENHAKLASELSMVKLEKNGPFFVSNTAFGNFCVSLSDNERLEIIKRLAIRNKFIQKLIFLAKNGTVSYTVVASKIISHSTLMRRKSNVRQIMSIILEDNEIYNNIVW